VGDAQRGRRPVVHPVVHDPQGRAAAYPALREADVHNPKPGSDRKSSKANPNPAIRLFVASGVLVAA